jgi:hypothetical protein
MWQIIMVAFECLVAITESLRAENNAGLEEMKATVSATWEVIEAIWEKMKVEIEADWEKMEACWKWRWPG